MINHLLANALLMISYILILCSSKICQLFAMLKHQIWEIKYGTLLALATVACLFAASSCDENTRMEMLERESAASVVEKMCGEPLQPPHHTRMLKRMRCKTITLRWFLRQLQN